MRKDGRYTQEDLYQLGVKLGEALESIHLAGVLHRDLKPSNVMLANGEPVLIDFGISQMGADSRLTQTGFLTHTPGFVIRGYCAEQSLMRLQTGGRWLRY
ncbi:protein kinase [Arcanobacterium hippocoleae]